MARIRVPLNNFVFGEISPSLISRVDSAIYNQSGQSVKNVFIRAEGGVINRAGTKRLHNFSQSYSQPSATITVTDYANIAVGTQLSFILDDGTKIILEFETSSADAPSTNIGNKYFVRAFTDNNTTADNIFTALNAISGLTSSNPASNVVTVTRDGTSITNLKVTTSDSTRLAVTDFSVTTQKIRLEPFIFSSDEKYVCAFSSGKIEIFRVNTDGSFNSLATTLTADSASAALPFTDANLQEFTYAQAGDFMFIAHNDFMPRELVRTGLTSFEVRTFTFDTSADGNKDLQPYYNFQASGVTITPSANTGSGISVTTSAAYFDTGTITATNTAATAIASGTRYQIKTVGTTDFVTDFGADSNTVGVVFVANAAGDGSSGTGTVDEVDESLQVGSALLIHDTQVDITAIISSTKATVDVNGTIEQQLDFDSLNTTEGSNKVHVIMPNHGLSTGDSITISDAGALGGINNSNINGTRTISRVLNENEFKYTAGGSASSTATGGGNPLITSTAATTDWFEQSYSNHRGFPAAVTFHEDRLWFGGTPSQPSGLWSSASGEYFNFDVGDGEAADAIDLEVSVGVTNFIRHLVSNRDLQVFCNQGEFFLPAFQDQPITASIAKISEQTPFGSSFVRPASLDGGTLFVQATGTAIREYIFNDSEGAYTTNMVSILSSHLISNPIQLTNLKGSLERPGSYAFFLMDTGEIAVFYSIRSEKRAGWMRWTTEGAYHSVCAVDESLFAVAVHDDGSGTNKFFLEQFDQTLNMDFSDTFDGAAGVFTVSSHFANGANVDVIDDTEYLGTFTVSGGQIDVSAVKSSVKIQAGYKFLPELKTNPIDVLQAPGGALTGRPRKITNVILDLEETLSVSVNDTNMIIRNVNFDPASPREPFTGKKEFRGSLGYSRDPSVTISQVAPLDMQLNGMVVEVAYS